MNQQALNPYFLKAEVAYRTERAGNRRTPRNTWTRPRISIRRHHDH